MINPIRGRVKFVSLAWEKICGISQELKVEAIHAMARIRPMSPTRL